MRENFEMYDCLATKQFCNVWRFVYFRDVAIVAVQSHLAMPLHLVMPYLLKVFDAEPLLRTRR